MSSSPFIWKAISSTPRPWRHWMRTATCSDGTFLSARMRASGQGLPLLIAFRAVQRFLASMPAAFSSSK